ncbi:MAG: thioredoxin [Bdellovibrionales bacterium]|nr:thioredoxin [Bdellovibrionales bacterium]
MPTKNTTDKDFQTDILESKGLVLVDFWAQWCGPCRALGPKLEEISEEHKESVNIYKINIDENTKTPSTYNVKGIPTMILFKDGQVMDQLVGNQEKESILNKIKEHKS